MKQIYPKYSDQLDENKYILFQFGGESDMITMKYQDCIEKWNRNEEVYYNNSIRLPKEEICPELLDPEERRKMKNEEGLMEEKLDLNQMIEGKVVGRGSFATVKQVFLNNGLMAIAKFSYFHKSKPYILQASEAEYNLLKKLNPSKNDYVIKIIGFKKLTEYCILVMEPYDCSLKQILNKKLKKFRKNWFSQSELLYIIKEIAIGVAFIHNNKIAHLDLKESKLKFSFHSPPNSLTIFL